MGKLAVKQPEGEEIATEVIADAIVAISDGMKRLRSGRLNDRALVLLIQHATGQSVSIRDIKAVLDGIEQLKASYIRKA